MKVQIDHDHNGWFYASGGLKSGPIATYAEAIRRASDDGHEIDNGGWRRRMLMWNFHNHALDGYPGWEIERDNAPAFVKLAHTRGAGGVESHKIASEWDDLAEVDFYQRDWTEDGLPTVRDGNTYWSGWWFATIAERDRFLEWHRARRAAAGCEGPAHAAVAGADRVGV